MIEYPLDKKLKYFSIGSLYREIYNREANEDLYQRAKNHNQIDDKVFPEGTEYIVFKYDVLVQDRKQYQINKTLAFRTLAIAESLAMNTTVKRGAKNEILVFGKTREFIRKANIIKVIFLSLECLGDPKLDWGVQCGKYFPQINEEARMQ